MKLADPVALVLLAPVALTTAYSCGPGYASCGPRGSAFRAASRMSPMSPQQQAEFRRQQTEFADRAFDAMARDLQSSKFDASTFSIPKQKEMMDKAVEFFSDMGGLRREDAESLKDMTNKGFEMAQDWASGAYSPAYDIQDKDDALEISLDLPGVAKSDIDIVYEDGLLKVSGTRTMGIRATTAYAAAAAEVDVAASDNDTTDNDNNQDATEQPPQNKIKSVPFARSFPVDAKTTNVEAIAATLESGVLFLRIPKKEIEKPPGKRINIQ